MLYAVWSEPNVDYQAQHFGKTVVAGDALRDFCIWYAAAFLGTNELLGSICERTKARYRIGRADPAVPVSG